MIEYNISTMYLTGIDYRFTKPDSRLINISVNDIIKIASIHDKQVDIVISRTLDFGEKADTYVNIAYEVSLDCSAEMTKESAAALLMNSSDGLTPVLSKISLLISQITNSSPFGVIITPPGYDSDEITIE